jgi:hypothetical protein
MEPATFRLLEQCLNQLRYRVPPFRDNIFVIILVDISGQVTASVV